MFFAFFSEKTGICGILKDSTNSTNRIPLPEAQNMKICIFSLSSAWFFCKGLCWSFFSHMLMRWAPLKRYFFPNAFFVHLWKVRLKPPESGLRGGTALPNVRDLRLFSLTGAEHEPLSAEKRRRKSISQRRTSKTALLGSRLWPLNQRHWIAYSGTSPGPPKSKIQIFRYLHWLGVWILDLTILPNVFYARKEMLGTPTRVSGGSIIDEKNGKTWEAV